MPPISNKADDQFGAQRAQTRDPAPVLSDFYSQLLFPRIFRAGPAAARPTRILVAAIAVLVVGIAAIVLPRSDPGSPVLLGWFASSLDLVVMEPPADVAGTAPLSIVHRVRFLLFDLPAQALTETPVTTLLALLLLAVVWAVPGLYIARGAGLELGRHINLKPSRALGLVRSKGPAAVAAVVLVPLFAAFLVAVPAVLGILLAVPGLDVLGSLLHGLGLLTALLAAMIMLTWIAAFWLVIPAVACDGADAFDATQRALGMFLSRPLSVGLHLLLAAVQGVVLVTLVWLVADLGSSMAAWAAGLFTERGAMLINAPGRLPESASATELASSALIVLWHVLPTLLAMAYAFSYAHTASVAVYLNARQFVDGQEPNELWMPEDPAGVTSAG